MNSVTIKLYPNGRLHAPVSYDSSEPNGVTSISQSDDGKRLQFKCDNIKHEYFDMPYDIIRD